jgi:hypothetical protein
MTDEHESLNEENKPSKPVPDVTGTDEIDVESALAAISSLHDLVREEKPEAVATESEATADDEALIIDDEPEKVIAEPVTDTVTDDDEYAEYTEIETVYSDFPRPPQSVLHRGQLASIVPAALLIGAGALMTITLTTSADAMLNRPLVLALTVSGLGVALVTYWFSSARWTIGSFFVGMAMLLMGGTAAYLLLPNGLDIAQGYPLLLTALGTAFVLTDLATPSNRRLWMVGLMFAIAGFAGMAITAQLLDAQIIATLSRFWYVALGVVVLLLIVPIFRRNRG